MSSRNHSLNSSLSIFLSFKSEKIEKASFRQPHTVSSVRLEFESVREVIASNLCQLFSYFPQTKYSKSENWKLNEKEMADKYLGHFRIRINDISFELINNFACWNPQMSFTVALALNKYVFNIYERSTSSM